MAKGSDPSLLDLRPGSLVAGYRLDAVLGAGGMGIVFRAFQPSLGRIVALKIVNPAIAGDRESMIRFIREARTGAAIDHPNVVPIYEIGDSDGLVYISMRYIEGRDLSALSHDEGPLHPDRAVDFVSQIAAALDAAHDRGLIHRDV